MELWPQEGLFKDGVMKDFIGDHGDKRQELVFIGQFESGDKEKLVAMLNDCVVTDAEMEDCQNNNFEDWEDPFEIWEYHDYDNGE